MPYKTQLCFFGLTQRVPLHAPFDMRVAEYLHLSEGSIVWLFFCLDSIQTAWLMQSGDDLCRSRFVDVILISLICGLRLGVVVIITLVVVFDGYRFAGLCAIAPTGQWRMNRNQYQCDAVQTTNSFTSCAHFGRAGQYNLFASRSLKWKPEIFSGGSGATTKRWLRKIEKINHQDERRMRIRVQRVLCRRSRFSRRVQLAMMWTLRATNRK